MFARVCTSTCGDLSQRESLCGESIRVCVCCMLQSPKKKSEAVLAFTNEARAKRRGPERKSRLVVETGAWARGAPRLLSLLTSAVPIPNFTSTPFATRAGDQEGDQQGTKKVTNAADSSRSALVRVDPTDPQVPGRTVPRVGPRSIWCLVLGRPVSSSLQLRLP